MQVDTAFERRYLDLVERNRARLGRICRAWSRTAADAEDLRAEILLQLWRALPGFDGRSSVDTWLYRVALNTAMLAGRGRGRRTDGQARLERETPPPAVDPDAEGRLDTDRRLARLGEAIRALPAADRALITLQLEEAPYAQIAEVLGMSESNVGVRPHRIKTRLGRTLAGEEGR